MYATAEGFGKISVPQNKMEKKDNEGNGVAEKADKENGIVVFTRKTSVVDMKKKEETVPIGPQKTKIQVKATQNLSNDGPIMQDTEQKLDHLRSKGDIQLESTLYDSDDDLEPINEQDPNYHALMIARQFRERVKQYKRKEMKNMITQDKIEFKDPQNVSEFTQEIYLKLREQEMANMVDPSYLQKVQKEIKDTSRAFLLEWIIDVHRKFRLVPEALYVTQFIIDQFLSKKHIPKSQLHLLGVATLLISTKYEEIYPPDLRDLLAVSENKFTRDQVIQMEKDILLTLDFKVTSPSSYRFLQRFKRISEKTANDDELFFYAQYVQEVSLLDASLLRFTPSQIAAASMILAAKQLRKTNCWDEDLEKFTGYTSEDLKEACDEVRSFAVEINPKFISTLKYKFSKPEYMKVANYQFKF